MDKRGNGSLHQWRQLEGLRRVTIIGSDLDIFDLRFFRQQPVKESYHGEEFRVAGNLPGFHLWIPTCQMVSLKAVAGNTL